MLSSSFYFESIPAHVPAGCLHPAASTPWATSNLREGARLSHQDQIHLAGPAEDDTRVPSAVGIQLAHLLVPEFRPQPRQMPLPRPQVGCLRNHPEPPPFQVVQPPTTRAGCPCIASVRNATDTYRLPLGTDVSSVRAARKSRSCRLHPLNMSSVLNATNCSTRRSTRKYSAALVERPCPCPPWPGSGAANW